MFHSKYHSIFFILVVNNVKKKATITYHNKIQHVFLNWQGIWAHFFLLHKGSAIQHDISNSKAEIMNE